MQETKSYKISVTKDAHLVAKTYCAIRGINAKDFVSNLILQSVGSSFSNMVSNLAPEVNQKIELEPNSILDHNRDSLEFNNYLDISNFAKIRDLSKAELPKDELSETNLSPIEHTDDEPDKIQLSKSKLLNNSKFEFSSPCRAGIITQQVFDLITDDSANAQTPEEISKLSSGISKSKVQTALYWLLGEGLIQRKLREDLKDKRKNSWEYWKLKNSNNLIRRGIDVGELLKALPQQTDKAILIGELAIKLNMPPSTIRDALRRLELTGQVGSIQGINRKNQTAKRYYRLSPEHLVPMVRADSQKVSSR